MKQKFVNITITGEGNIGVIDLGKIKQSEYEEKQAILIRQRAEPKMVKALEQHFDCQVKVLLLTTMSTLGVIELRAVVIIGSDEDHPEEVVMKETWVY